MEIGRDVLDFEFTWGDTEIQYMPPNRYLLLALNKYSEYNLLKMDTMERRN